VKIEDSFRVEVPVEEAWKVLLDLERIAPCLPGAQLTEVEGDEYRGTVKIKVGPITAQYKGVAKIEQADEANRKVVLQAEGRDTRGQGNASATVVATLVPDGDGTTVNIDTDLNITGKVAQFGRGVMADVSSKLLGQFADNLKKDVLSGSETPTEPSAAPSATADGGDKKAGTASAVDAGFASTGESDAGPRKIESKEAEPIDLMDAAGGSVGKRLAPIVGGVVVLLVVRSVLKRRKRHRDSRSGLADLGEQAKHQAKRHAKKARKEAARHSAEARKLAAKQAKEVGKRAAKQAHELREHAGHAVHVGVRHLGH
jgi:carbon monoxide dehydrogenase subunit G